MATRHRGRRPIPDQRKVQKHHSVIQEIHAHRLELRKALEQADKDLSHAIEEAISDSVATNEIGTWLKSAERPDGISRQMVYKLISQQSENGKANTKPRRAARKRPGQKGGV